MTTNLVTLRNRQLGMPMATAKVQTCFLNMAKFYLRTKLGTSKIFYGNSADTPQHGQGQGAKWAPMSWIGISTLLLDIIAQLSPHRITISDTKQILHDTRQMDGYVDDFTSWMNISTQIHTPYNKKNDSTREITNQLQQLSQTWEHLLTCTGGKLELTKCFNYILNWKFDKHGRPYLNEKNIPNLDLNDSTSGDIITIDRKLPNEPHRTLGIFISPTENDKMAVKELTKKCNKFATLLRASRSCLTKNEIITFMNSIYKPSITYMLPATSLSEQQCKSIQSNLVRNIATSMGMNRHFPPVLLHAPKYLGGTNIPDLYCEQGVSQITFVIRHIRGNTRVGKLLRIVFDWMQTYCGTEKNFLENVSTPIEKYTPIKWIQSIRKFLRDTEFYLKILNAPVIPPRRDNDRCLMDIALNHKFTPMELRDINNCRMYLRVETLSNITTACGNFVQQTALGRTPPEGPPDTFFSSIPTKLFPRQSKPGLDAWKNWLKLIKISTGEYKGRLDNKLGNWHATGARERMWKSYIRPDNNDNLITMIRKGTWEVCQIFDEKRTIRKYKGTTAEPWTTDSESLTTGTWIPVDIRTYDEHWITTGQPQQQNEINDQTELENDERQLLAHLEMDQYEKLKNILTAVDTIQISVATRQHQQQGWYTWTITSPTLASESRIIQGGTNSTCRFSWF